MLQMPSASASAVPASSMSAHHRALILLRVSTLTYCLFKRWLFAFIDMDLMKPSGPKPCSPNHCDMTIHASLCLALHVNTSIRNFYHSCPLEFIFLSFSVIIPPHQLDHCPCMTATQFPPPVHPSCSSTNNDTSLSVKHQTDSTKGKSCHSIDIWPPASLPGRNKLTHITQCGLSLPESRK